MASVPNDIDNIKDRTRQFYSSVLAHKNVSTAVFPKDGMAAKHVERYIRDQKVLDFQPRLNTSSYVNVCFEAEELEVAKLGMEVNIADQTVYPQSFKLHNDCVNMIANLWHCPKSEDFDDYGCFPGAGTVGSTEACLLAGLALKFRWRAWYAKKKGLTEQEVLGVLPNMVITTQYQAAWEKFFKYMDVEAHIMPTSVANFSMDPKELSKHVDEKTIAVVCIMGNHYGGHYDPVWEVNDEVERLNKENGFQLGIHVDGASGGFIAPFQSLPAWDFRLNNVLSISASGHKFGDSVCGTGWVVWRQRKGLSEHVAISVSYLGGKADSYTLNFSRPATGIYVQLYKFLRLGLEGYSQMEKNMCGTAEALREQLRSMKTKSGVPRFRILDASPKPCLPVVTAMLNPDAELAYDDIDLQHQLAEDHWYVSGYTMAYHHPNTGKQAPLFLEFPVNQTMFRVVVKSNLTLDLMKHLMDAFNNSVEVLDQLSPGYLAVHPNKQKAKRQKKEHHGATVC